MRKLLVEKIPRIIKAKKKLRKELGVKISNRGKEVYLEGSGEDEFFAEKVIEAIDFGFSISHALRIREEDLDFERLNIKDYTKSKNLERVRGRIIGKEGKALKVLSDLTDCFFEMKDNEVGIIGYPENIENAQKAIIQLAQGAKHGHVYAGLEKNRPFPVEDLGLKDK